ncbi:hypothetical protein ABW19_dt0202199 [Dactylella cylindrospora]|nr:hypothetical protein ABW19_dt0202199 [Dactylella cylindrospora]
MTSTPEQQMQYIQYMLQAPLAPVLNTTPAEGELSSSLQLSQPSSKASDDTDTK